MEELQRSVAFYTKANASLSLHNRELEHKIIMAKQHLQHLGNGTSNLKGAKSEQVAIQPEAKSHEVMADANTDAELKPAAVPVTAGTAQFSSFGASQTQPEAEEAKPPATQALHPTQMAASTSPFATAVNPNLAVAAGMIQPPSLDSNQVQFPTPAATANPSEDEYIEGLRQFAAQQAAVAQAAAASANAAMQAIKYHETMKQSGQSPTARFPLTQFHQFASSPKKNQDS